MPNSNGLREIIQQQGQALQKRAEWLQTAIDRQSQSVLNAQKAVEHFSGELQAVNQAIELLREEYKRIVGNGE